MIQRCKRNSRTLNSKCCSSLCPAGLKTVVGWRLGGGGEGQILFQPCAMSILGKVLCLCLLLVIGSFDAKHQHPTTACVPVQNPCARSKVASLTETSRCRFVSIAIKSQTGASISATFRISSHIASVEQCKLFDRTTHTVLQGAVSHAVRHKQSFL